MRTQRLVATIGQLNAVELAATILARGGITLDTTTGRQPDTGYAVALPGAERRLFGMAALDRHDELAIALEQYAIDYEGPLSTAGRHLGAWVDSEDVVLDVSIITTDPINAATFGREFEQDAIYCLHTGETTYLR